MSNICYAMALGDCDGKLSLEHFISRNLLQEIGNPGLKIGGISWHRVGPTELAPSNLQARILCQKHNENLSILDIEVGRFFKALRDFYKKETKGVNSFNGEIVERWMIKVLCGLLASGNISRTDGLPSSQNLPLWLLEILFGHKTMPANWGLRFFDVTEPQMSELEVTLNSHRDGRIWGIRIGFVGFNFQVALMRVNYTGSGINVYRPRALVLEDEGRIQFDWSDSTLKQEVNISRTPKDSRGVI